MKPEESYLLAALSRWDLTLFHLGNTTVRLSTLVAVLVALLLLFALSGWLQHWFVRRLARHTNLSVGTRQMLGSLLRYVVLVLGFLAVLQSLGLNLSAFSVVAGALGVGIGFGLQNIVSNFISGLIIMVERPVKIGDRIEIAGAEGDVIAIGARATRLRTARNATVIVPNQKFITENLRNWDVGDRTALLIVAKAARDQDPRQVERLLLEIARAHQAVLDQPEPAVYLNAMDASGFAFELETWVAGDARDRARVTSALYFSLHEQAQQREIKLV